MRLEHYAVAAVLLGLTACGGASKNDGKSEEKQSAAASAAAGAVSQINPGEWEMTITTSGVPDPSLPPAAAAAMRKGSTDTDRKCITKEEASKPPADMLSAENGDCKTTEMNVNGGILHAVSTCAGEDGGKTVSTTDGQFGGDTLDLTSKIETSGPNVNTSLTAHVVGRRVGECTAKGG